MVESDLKHTHTHEYIYIYIYTYTVTSLLITAHVNMASQMTGDTNVCSTAHTNLQQRKHRRTALLVFCESISPMKHCITGPFWWTSMVTSAFPLQLASNAERVSMACSLDGQRTDMYHVNSRLLHWLSPLANEIPRPFVGLVSNAILY